MAAHDTPEVRGHVAASAAQHKHHLNDRGKGMTALKEESPAHERAESAAVEKKEPY